MTSKDNGKASSRRRSGNGESSSRRRRIRMKFAESGRLTEKREENAELPEPTEQETRFIELLEESLTLGDDVGRAAARFMKDTLIPRLREGDEQPEEFDVEEFQNIADELARLRIIRLMLPLFGMEAYEARIMSHFIDKAFQGRRKGSGPAAVFLGNDEQFMDHMARTTE